MRFKFTHLDTESRSIRSSLYLSAARSTRLSPSQQNSARFIQDLRPPTVCSCKKSSVLNSKGKNPVNWYARGRHWLSYADSDLVRYYLLILYTHKLQKYISTTRSKPSHKYNDVRVFIYCRNADKTKLLCVAKMFSYNTIRDNKDNISERLASCLTWHAMLEM